MWGVWGEGRGDDVTVVSFASGNAFRIVYFCVLLVIDKRGKRIMRNSIKDIDWT